MGADLIILKLRLGDLLADDSAGKIGKVVGFMRDFVLINWGHTAGAAGYTDADLKAHGVRLVEGSR